MFRESVMPKPKPEKVDRGDYMESLKIGKFSGKDLSPEKAKVATARLEAEKSDPKYRSPKGEKVTRIIDYKELVKERKTEEAKWATEEAERLRKKSEEIRDAFKEYSLANRKEKQKIKEKVPTAFEEIKILIEKAKYPDNPEVQKSLNKLEAVRDQLEKIR